MLLNTFGFNDSVCLLDLSVGLVGKFYCFSEAESNNINSVQSRTQHLRPRSFSIDDYGVILN